jgi:hypothetical protein
MWTRTLCRAGFLESFDLAHANADTELVALADHSLGVAGTGFHSQGDDVSGEGFEVNSRIWGGLIGLGCDLGHGSTVTKWGAVARHVAPHFTACAAPSPRATRGRSLSMCR